MATKSYKGGKPVCELTTGQIIYKTVTGKYRVTAKGKMRTLEQVMESLSKSDKRRVRKGLEVMGCRQEMLATLPA